MVYSSSSYMVGSFGLLWGFQAWSSFDSGKESEISHLIYTPRASLVFSLESLALTPLLFPLSFLHVRGLCDPGRDPEQDIPGDQEHHEDGHGHVSLRGGRTLRHQNH